MVISWNNLVINGTTVEAADLTNVASITGDVQTQLGTKAPLASPTFTGEINISTNNAGYSTPLILKNNNTADSGKFSAVLVGPTGVGPLTNGDVLLSSDTGNIHISSNKNGKHLRFISNSWTASTSMTLNDTGNLLVGTTTDNGVDKLQVNGSIRANGSNIAPLMGINCGGNTTTWYNLVAIQANFSKFQVATSENNYIQFWDISYAAGHDALAFSKAPDTGHAHSSDFTFRVSNGYLQCKNVSYTTSRLVYVINVLMA